MNKSTQRRVLSDRDFNQLVFATVPAFGYELRSFIPGRIWIAPQDGRPENIPSCTNLRNPPHTVASTTTRKRKSEILFGSIDPSAKMLPQISEKNFSLYCLNISPYNKYHKIFNKQNVHSRYKLLYYCTFHISYDWIAQQRHALL